MSRVTFFYILGRIALTCILTAQLMGQTMPEYSNGAFELYVDHARPEAGVTRKGQDLYGILTIRMKNTSQEPLTIALGDPDCDFAIDIRDASVNPARLSALGERLLPKTQAERKVCYGLSGQTVELGPGQEYSLRWYINRLFQLDRGTPYTANVTWAKGMRAKTRSGRPLRQVSRMLTIK